MDSERPSHANSLLRRQAEVLRLRLRYCSYVAPAAWLFASGALAAPLVSGTVAARTGAPLADVQVQVEIRSVKTAGSTDLNGHFQFDAAKLFSPGELRDALGLMLMFSKPGFQPVNRLVHPRAGEVVNVQLDPTGSGAGLAPADKEELDNYRATPGSAPLFLIPYSFAGIPSAREVNDGLRANLERVIVTHLQGSGLGGSAMVALKLLPPSPGSDIDRMRAVGSYLDALGMITGMGEAEAGTGGSRTLRVSSTFLVVPRVEAVVAPVLYVDDDMPADSVTSPLLYTHLSKLWGRSTVLALGVSEFGKARAANDKKALTRIRTYLQAERAGAGPGDEALVSQLNTLITAVDKELAK